MDFILNVYKDSEGFFIASPEYSNLFGWAEFEKDIVKTGKDIVSVMKDNLMSGKPDTSGMPFIRSFSVKTKETEKV